MSHTEFNFGDFLRVLKKWLALVIILPVIAGSGAFAYFYVTYVPQFTATAIVACSAKQTSSGNIDGSTLSTSKEVAKTFKYMMTQSTTLQDAADILHENEEIEYNAYNAGTLAGMISITQVEDTYLLNVSATASNRIVARDVANAVADASVKRHRHFHKSCACDACRAGSCDRNRFSSVCDRRQDKDPGRYSSLLQRSGTRRYSARVRAVEGRGCNGCKQTCR